jgi:hypothetical protein
LPIGEAYLAYHTYFGLSLGLGGGAGFCDYEDLNLASGWDIYAKGNSTTYRVKAGARYTFPGYEDFGAIGMNLDLGFGKTTDNLDAAYDAVKSNDPRFGFQAEFGYPRYLKGAIGYEIATMNEEFYWSENDTSPDKNKDKFDKISLKTNLLGDGLNVPVMLGFRFTNTSTAGTFGENEPVNLTISDLGIGISSVPVEWLTISAEYNKSNWEIKSDSTYTIPKTGFSLGLEVYPVHEFGIRAGFESFDFEPDPSSEFVFPLEGFPAMRYGYYGTTVPDISSGKILSGGIDLRLDDSRMNVEITVRNYFADKPEIYNNETGNRTEGFFGISYLLR